VHAAITTFLMEVLVYVPFSIDKVHGGYVIIFKFKAQII